MKNLASMMKQAQEIQSRMAEMQAELDQLRIEGTSGAGLVRLTLNGKGEMVSLGIDASLLKPDEGEILEDLVVAAHADARSRMEGQVQEKMKALTGGLPLPPGLKLF